MKARRYIGSAALAVLAVAWLPLALSGAASAATATTSSFIGTVTSTMTVNNGSNTGSIPAGTSYTGTLTYDSGQTPTAVAYGGGTHTVYAFTNLTFTIGGSTAVSGPGSIDVFDNLTTTTGYPSGDSVYVNFTQGVPNTTGVAPSGLLSGAAFNWMGLALLDPSGVVISGGQLPANLDSANFATSFSEFNFGTKGTAWGAGNTSMIQGLTSLTSIPGVSTTTTTPTTTPTTAPTTTTPPSTTTTTLPAPVVCSGSNQVETAYVARNPGFIVVNGGLNLLDHLWTTNLNAGNTTFLGGLVNWYKTGLIVSWTGTADPSGCILDHLTVAPAVTISSTSLPAGTVGQAYSAPIDVAWGVGPYTLSATGLPAGLSVSGTAISGTPTQAGTFSVSLSASDSVGGTASAQLSLTIARPAANYSITDEGKGKITAIGPGASYVMVGTKKLVWNGSTVIIVNTPNGVLHVVDGFVKIGMKVQWKGLRDKATNTVLTSQIEIN